VGKHPVAVGSTGASLDVEQIGRWWASYPSANVAIRTGDGLLVIDVDNKPDEGRDGLATWARLVAANGGHEDTVTARTGSGGLHVFFRTLAEIPNCHDTEKLGVGIDVRGHNGYVIAAPSRHRSGREYAWAPGFAPSEIAVAPAPTWLVARLTRTEPAQAPRAPRTSRPSPTAPVASSPGVLPPVIASGARHTHLLRLSGAIRNRGLGEKEILAVLAEVNVRRCAPPWSDAEVRTLAHNVSRLAVRADYAPPLADVIGATDLRRELESIAVTMWRRGLDAFEIAAGLVAIGTRVQFDLRGPG
jgi:hypothetical protein